MNQYILLERRPKTRTLSCIASSFISAMVCVAWICGPDLLFRSAHASEELGNAFADLPDVALWHLKVFWMLPRNLSDFEKAWDEEKAKLKPGEKKEYDVMMTVNPGNGDPIRFVALRPAGEKWLLPAGIRPVATVTIDKARYILNFPLEPLLKEVFDKALKSIEPKLTSEDHTFAIDAWKRHDGWKDGIANLRLIDLLNRTARAGADGRVILVAQKDQETYFVYDETAGKVQTHKKGRTLADMGNTVWIHCKPATSRGYTLVYRHLEQPSKFEAGTEIKVGETIGKYLTDKQGTFLAIWRTDNANQYFLRNGAYRVAALMHGQ